jgi:hypothetical protein
MNYFWVVIALVVLLYIFFKMFRGRNKYGAVRNAFLAKYTYDQLTKEEQKQVHELTEDIRRRGGGGIPLSDMADMLKYSLYAFGMGELGISPSLPGEKWDYVKNPFLAMRGTSESQIQAIKYKLEHKHKVNIDLKTPKEAIDEMLNKRMK